MTISALPLYISNNSDILDDVFQFVNLIPWPLYLSSRSSSNIRFWITFITPCFQNLVVQEAQKNGIFTCQNLVKIHRIYPWIHIITFRETISKSGRRHPCPCLSVHCSCTLLRMEDSRGGGCYSGGVEACPIKSERSNVYYISMELATYLFSVNRDTEAREYLRNR